jgi:hypothetical protein
MLPGSGTTLAGCATKGIPTINISTSIIVVVKNVQCSIHTARVEDVYVEDTTHGSIRWTSTITSNSTAPWSADIVAGLGYADWNKTGKHPLTTTTTTTTTLPNGVS